MLTVLFVATLVIIWTAFGLQVVGVINLAQQVAIQVGTLVGFFLAGLATR